MKFSSFCVNSILLIPSFAGARVLGTGNGRDPDADTPQGGRVCRDSSRLTWSGATEAVISNTGFAEDILETLELYADGFTIGSTRELIVEAQDAAVSGATVRDGRSGDTDFPFGDIKAIATMGERSVCDESTGQTVVGKPDGVGAYLLNDKTVRLIYQSESYGPLEANEARTYPVNDGKANMGGSYIAGIDYDRDMMSRFMNHGGPASNMVVGYDSMIKKAYNLRGEPLGPRMEGNTTVGAHLSNTDADGQWAVASLPRIEYDWFYQSLCSAHLEEAHQWGPGIGVEDDLFITNEEWHTFNNVTNFVGNSVHVLDIKEKTMYAAGAFTMGGFEKLAELNPQSPDHVMFAVAGYNGDYEGNYPAFSARKEEYGTRPDGSEYVWPVNVVPYRMYVGVKGLMEDGSKAPEDDFLARNGLRYGQVYGFAIDMSEDGPSHGLWRDDFHKNATYAHNGAKVEGKWVAQPWKWDGTVRNFEHDGSWDFQLPVPGMDDDYKWWNSAGYDESGAKTEHLTPDARPGKTGFVQGSTAGYFGHLYVLDVEDVLKGVSGDELPKSFDGEYYVYQGELDVTSQIELGGKFKYTDDADGNRRDATRNWDSTDGEGKVTFEDIDGLEMIHTPTGMHVVIQEDSGNLLGERCLISGPLEHEDDGKELTYYMVAVSGGGENTRMVEGVGIPAGANAGAGAHEFSGIFDLSGLLRKEKGSFALRASEKGYRKREEDAKVELNDKYIILNLQASNFEAGAMKHFGADTGGQIMIYKPSLP